jgi:antitoxin component of MazEF toxin-antitoxin module
MRTKLTEVGNGLGLVIDKPLLKELGIDRETELELRIEGKALIIEHVRQRRERVAEASRRVMGSHDRTFRKLSK